MQRKFPARLAILLRGFARRFQHVGGNARDAGGVFGVMREGIGSVEKVIGKTRRQLRKLLADFLESALLVRRQFRAAEPKVAQRMIDDRALRLTQLTERRARLQLLELQEQP